MFLLRRYAAPISVDVEYTRGKEIVVRKGKDGQVKIVTAELIILDASCKNLKLSNSKP
jgi:hypothetical protein